MTGCVSCVNGTCTSGTTDAGSARSIGRTSSWNDSLVVEIKAIRKVTDLEVAQTLTYLKLSGCTLGLILNFNVANMQKGVRRVVLGYGDGAI